MSGGGESASRPNSLVLDAPAPEREPLHFDVQLIGAPPEVEQLVNNIKQVAEDFLYHWKTFPIVLPPSRFTGPGNKLSDIIIPPPCDELDTAVLDAGLEPEPLSPKQLHSIREKGEFEVASRLFPGQTHVWRVAGWLQRGRARAREDFLQHVARAVALVVVVARDRILSDGPVSLRASFVALKEGLYRLLDLLIGMPSMEARDLEKKIREERSRYLVAELICKPEHLEDVSAVAAWVSRGMRRVEAGGGGGGGGGGAARPRVPVHYSTPQRTSVDLRLYRRDTLRRAAPALQALLDREARGWFLHFRERTAAHLATQKVPESEMCEEVRAAAMREYVRRVCAALEGGAAPAALSPALAPLLADQLRAAAVLERAEQRVAARLRASLASHEARLHAAHPLLARSRLWLAPRAAAAARRLAREVRWAAREEAAAALAALRLQQQRYFLLRDLAFLRDREPLLAAELRAATQPTRTFAWTHAADPGPTVARSRSPARAGGAGAGACRARWSSTRWAGWRVCNAAHRARCWTWRALHVLLVLVAWDSPLSVRTLLRRDPVPPDLELSQVNGTLYPKRSSETHTMWSRLRALWRHIAKERTRIDAEPDTGLVEGGAARALRRAALAGAGGAGSLALLVVFPACVLAVCLLALLAACAAPLCAPPLALLHHALNALIYDFDCPRPGRLNRWFPLVETAAWRLGARGVVQPLAALALALAAGPACALALAAGAAWAAARAAWEAAAWRAVIARRARVPRHDSVFCRRVAGPGLTARASLQLSPAQAVAAAAARAELAALAAWQARMERAIERPLRDYEHFVDACFGPFSVRIAESGSYRQLQRECAALVGELRGASAARRRDLASPQGDAARARCRLTPQDLRRTRAAAASEVRRAWRGEARAEEWWSARGLEPDDWAALAADALVDAFDADVLVPLEDGAARMPLDTGTGGGIRLWEGVVGRAAAPPDVLGAAGAAEAAVAAPRVPPPALDVSAFSPRAHRHPPLPSPAMVALLLHNRDSDTPVPLESELCAEIIRSLEDAPDADADSVERYRGGGSSEGSSSDGEDDEPTRRADTSDSRSGESGATRGVATPGTGTGGAGGVAGGAEGGRGACRWTLTGRGVRLRADLASPEDVTLDAERRGTSV